MSVAEEIPRPWIPNDTFAVRLAAIRVALGELFDTGAWNVKKTAMFCGIDAGSWRNWEASVHPQDYIAVCSKIAEKTGCDLDWLVRGGPLPNPIIRWSSDPRHLTCENYASENADQLPLDFDAMDRRAGLELVTT